jgi:hypothetical protein
MPENPADAHLNAWTLAGGADRLPHALRGFWDPPIYYPYSGALAFTENLLGITVLVAPVQWLFGDPVLTYNVALLLAFVLSALGAYLLAREITGSRRAAVIAGCAFGFAPYRWSHLGHLQVIFVGWLAIGLWALHRALRTGSWGVLGLVAVALPLQMLANGYTAFLIAIAVPLVMIWSAVRDRGSRRMVARLAVVGFAIGLVLLPAIVAYGRTQRQLGTAIRDIASNSADLGSYLAEVPGLPLATVLPGVNSHEGYLFPGVVVVVLAALALTGRARASAAVRMRWLYLAIGLIAIALSLGPAPRVWRHAVPLGAMYSWLLDIVPMLGLVRVPARFGMLAILAFAMLAAMGAARTLPRFERRRAAAATAVLCAAILFEGYGGPLKLERQGRLSPDSAGAEYGWLADRTAGAVLHLPISTLDRTNHGLQHQFAVLLHRHPIVNGVSRQNPSLPTFLASPASPFVDPATVDQAVAFLRGLDIRYLLIRPEDFEDPSIARRLIDRLTADPHARVGALFAGTLAYEIEPAASEDDDPLEEVAPAAFRLSASDQNDRVGLAADGDVATRWLSGRPQNGTEWIAVEFDRPRPITRIAFTFARSVSDFPRGLEISADPAVPGAPAPVLYRGTALEALGRGWVRSPELPVAWIDFPPQTTRRLLIRQTGVSDFWYWSVDELTVWEEADAVSLHAADSR